MPSERDQTEEEELQQRAERHKREKRELLWEVFVTPTQLLVLWRILELSSHNAFQSIVSCTLVIVMTDAYMRWKCLSDWFYVTISGLMILHHRVDEITNPQEKDHWNYHFSKVFDRTRQDTIVSGYYFPTHRKWPHFGTEFLAGWMLDRDRANIERGKATEARQISIFIKLCVGVPLVGYYLVRALVMSFA